ncbi:MAG: tetratricopeptide repeat protein [Caldilineaceae bacterium]
MKRGLRSDAWFELLKEWEEAIRSKEWPVLLLLEYDYPHALYAPTVGAQPDSRLTWLRERCGAPNFLAEMLHLGPLTHHAIAEILLPEAQQYAHDLFLLSDGMPKTLHDLLDWWRGRGIAEEALTGYWTIRQLPTDTYLFTADGLWVQIQAALTASAERVADLGYELSADDLQEWLNHAVWEGDTFHDRALAQAIGWDREAIDNFLTIVDEALCQSTEHPHGLTKLDGMIEVPLGNGQTRKLKRYHFVEPLVAVLLRQRQSGSERLRYGQAYAQALLAVYSPSHEQILETMATLYQSLGLTEVAADYRRLWNTLLYLTQEEAALTALLPGPQDESAGHTFVRRILRFFKDAYRRRHPQQLLPWLGAALALSQQLGVKGLEATALHETGVVYRSLGEMEAALHYYNQSLPLYRVLGERSNEATTLTNIGVIYSALGETQQALAFYEQALPLYRAVGDRGGEATTLNNIGGVYDALGEKQQALAFYEQALPLRRAVGDRGGEATTLTNIGGILFEEGDFAKASEHFEQALAVQMQVGNRFEEVIIRWWLATLYLRQAEQEKALAELATALALATKIQSPHASAIQQLLAQTQAAGNTNS